MTGRTILAVVAVAMLLTVQAMADTIFSDTFTLNTTNRTAGTVLNGLTTEVGGLTWKGTDKLGGNSSDGYASSAGTNNAWGSVVLAAAPTDTVTLTTVISGVDGTTNWFSIGMGNQATNRISDASQKVWLLVHKGYTMLFTPSTTDVNPSGAGITTAGNHTIQFIYDPTALTVTITIDGATPTAFNAVSISGWQPSNSTVVGFGNNGTQDTLHVTDFSMTMVPEPATLALLGVGGLAMLRRRSRG